MELKQKIVRMDRYKLALAEVDAIIDASDTTEQEKISSKFRNFIKMKKDPTYNFSIDNSKSLADQNIMHETKIILSLIYRSYFCSPEERERLALLDQEEQERKKAELREKYNTDNLFNRNINKVQDNQTNETENEIVKEESMVVYKENFFTKFINKIKQIFFRKK